MMELKCGMDFFWFDFVSVVHVSMDSGQSHRKREEDSVICIFGMNERIGGRECEVFNTNPSSFRVTYFWSW